MRANTGSWIRTCRLRSWFSSTVFRTALSEMSRIWEEWWQQWFYNAVIFDWGNALPGQWRSRFHLDYDNSDDNNDNDDNDDDNKWQRRRLPGRWSPQLYLDQPPQRPTTFQSLPQRRPAVEISGLYFSRIWSWILSFVSSFILIKLMLINEHCLSSSKTPVLIRQEQGLRKGSQVAVRRLCRRGSPYPPAQVW